MTELLIDIFTWIFFVIGSFFIISGGLGLIRLPDVFTRIHAAGLIDTLGASFILIGMMLQGGFELVTLKLIFVLIFILFTSPTASHALGHAARIDNVKPWKKPKQRESVK